MKFRAVVSIAFLLPMAGSRLTSAATYFPATVTTLKPSRMTVVMRKYLTAVWLICVLAITAGAQTTDSGERFDSPPPKAALDLVKRGLDLAERDRVAEAIVTLKRAITLAPNFLEAHRQYVRMRADLQGKIDEVTAEYESLMTKQPDNPVYPMALALVITRSRQIGWLKKVAQLAPEWSWGHYARAYAILGRTYLMLGNETLDGKGDQIIDEFSKAIEKDSTVAEFYGATMFYQNVLGRIDDAVLTAEKMAAQPGLRATGLSKLWRLRLTKAKGSGAARESLNEELSKLARGSRDIKLLAAIRDAYADVLKDTERVNAVERQIRRLSPDWYPERGMGWFLVEFNLSGIPYPLLAVNRQYSIYEKVKQIVLKREADWRKEARQLEKLRSLGPNPGLNKLIFRILFVNAQKAGEAESMVKYGEQLYALDATDIAPFARIALALAANKTDLQRALDYARRAEAALAEFHLIKRAPDIPDEDFRFRFSLEEQQGNYRRQRALALDAVGWALSRMGQAKEAEPKLRLAVQLDRTETRLTHLAETLKQLGQTEEAEKIVVEINATLLASIKKQFINKPAKDFQLEAIDGRKYRLSDLKGKVVLVNFWATWCGPCVGEMPLFVRIYEKYKDRGFELLAISSDDSADRDQVARFAKEHRLNFPVLYDDKVAELYDVDGFPRNVFIDRQGNIRYLQTGAFDDGGRRLEAVLNELLK
jgi:peroxiredoxin/Tfp pilus assembly protein PilF